MLDKSNKITYIIRRETSTVDSRGRASLNKPTEELIITFVFIKLSSCREVFLILVKEDSYGKRKDFKSKERNS